MLVAKPQLYPDKSSMSDSIVTRADDNSSTNISIPVAFFTIGEVVKHRMFDFRGVIYDVDPTYSNDDEWYESIPIDLRPRKNQPFYHLFAENNDSSYIAYVSQQNLIADGDSGPINHPQINEVFGSWQNDHYTLRDKLRN